MGKEKKMWYGLKKTKYMIVKTAKEKEEIVQVNVKSGEVCKTKTYHQLGITINEEGNLEEHIKVIARKCANVHNKQGNRCYRGKYSSWKRGNKG